MWSIGLSSKFNFSSSLKTPNKEEVNDLVAEPIANKVFESTLILFS